MALVVANSAFNVLGEWLMYSDKTTQIQSSWGDWILSKTQVKTQNAFQQAILNTIAEIGLTCLLWYFCPVVAVIRASVEWLIRVILTSVIVNQFANRDDMSTKEKAYGALLIFSIFDTTKLLLQVSYYAIKNQIA